MTIIRACLHQYRLKVHELVLKINFKDSSVVHAAAEQGDIVFFRAVVTCMEQRSTPEQVRVNQP